MNVQEHLAEIGKAQVSYRVENEAIEASADRLALLGQIPFVCECPDRDCAEIVRLSFDEYEAIRQYPRRFFNVSGHETASVEAGAERIVAVAGALTVVEMVGVSGDVADDAHDRPLDDQEHPASQLGKVDNMPSGSTLLLRSQNLIEQGWTQGADARDADGEPVRPWSSEAVAWSLLGALVAALEAEADENSDLAGEKLVLACTALATVIEVDSLESWNDDVARTFDEVLDALDQAATRTA